MHIISRCERKLREMRGERGLTPEIFYGVRRQKLDKLPADRVLVRAEKRLCCCYAVVGYGSEAIYQVL